SPWLGLCDRPVDQIRARIVAAGNPRVASGTKRERQIAPRLPARLAGPRDGRRPPQLIPRLRVESGDKADVVLVELASRDARDDPAPGDDRPAREAIAECVVGNGLVPYDFAGPGIEGDDVGFGG